MKVTESKNFTISNESLSELSKVVCKLEEKKEEAWKTERGLRKDIPEAADTYLAEGCAYLDALQMVKKVYFRMVEESKNQ